jgi:hypothetical protein
VQLRDADGRVLAWNDDHMDKDGHLHTGPGLLTHHADSYLRVRIPADGDYFFTIADTQNQGGEEWGYRLHLAPPRPDFEVKVAPASLTLTPRRSTPVDVHVRRFQGFDGPVEIALVDPAPGLTLEGGWVPAGRQHVRMTVTAPPDMEPQLVPLRFVGYAEIGEEVVMHEAVPSENQMQAFLWRHLVPAEEMIAKVTKGRRYLPRFEVACELPLQLPLGGTAVIPVMIDGTMPEKATPSLTLSGAPDGIALAEVEYAAGGMMAVIEASDSALKIGYADNLIADVEITFDRTDKEGNTRSWTTPVGSLRAIPFEIVAR